MSNRRNLGLAGGVLLLAAAIATPIVIRSLDEQRLKSCASNLFRIKSALELYAADHAGHYPNNLAELTQDAKYLKSIPTCPAAARDTYSSSYTHTNQPARFTYYCSGSHHDSAFGRSCRDVPGYSSTGGILEP